MFEYYLFVDAENIPISKVRPVLTQIPQQKKQNVFVFSTSPTTKSKADSLSYTVISDYPRGKNQADFRIISAVSSVCSYYLANNQKTFLDLRLLSSDRELGVAFNNVCDIFKVLNSRIYRYKDISPPKTEKHADDINFDFDAIVKGRA